MARGTDASPDHPEAPLYERIKRELIEAIARGEFVPGEPFITQREVCERYGVSTTTAVRALNDLAVQGVLVRHRGRGSFVAEQPVAAPTDAGSTEPTPLVACVIHGEGPHRAALVGGVGAAATENGLGLLLFDSQNSTRLEAEAVRRALAAGVRGVVLYPADGSPGAELSARFSQAGVPVVLLDRYWPDAPTDAVLADNFAVGFELTSALIERGHTAIATLWDEVDCTSVRDRMAGHLRALRSHGLPVRAEFTALRPYPKLPSARRIALLRGMLEADSPPTVVMCANGFLVAQVARDLLTLEVAVPDAMDVAGMDDAGPYDLLPLTTVAATLPSAEMGREAVTMLASRLHSPSDAGEHRVLGITLRTRDSSPAFLRVASTR